MWSLVLLLVTTAASGDELERAHTQYGEMKYEAALKSLSKAITSPGLTRTDRAEIYLYTGLCRHQAGDEKGALAAFREALTIDRTLKLPSGTAPKVALTWDRALASLPPLPVETPVVTTTPTEPTQPIALVTPVVPSAPPSPTTVKRWWPMGLSFGLAAAALAAGIVLGNVAQTTSTRAQTEPFGSDGFTLAQQARGQATGANVLFGVAGGIAAFGVVAAFVF